jgi:hypothetical protein
MQIACRSMHPPENSDFDLRRAERRKRPFCMQILIVPRTTRAHVAMRVHECNRGFSFSSSRHGGSFSRVGSERRICQRDGGRSINLARKFISPPARTARASSRGISVIRGIPRECETISSLSQYARNKEQPEITGAASLPRCVSVAHRGHVPHFREETRLARNTEYDGFHLSAGSVTQNARDLTFHPPEVSSLTPLVPEKARSVEEKLRR